MRFYNLHELARCQEAADAFRPMAAATYPPSVLEAYDRDRKRSGYPAALKVAAEALIEESKSTYINPIEIANAFLMAGDTQQGLEYLERACEVHDPNVIALTQPMYDCVREEPRFRDIAHRVGVSPDALQ